MKKYYLLLVATLYFAGFGFAQCTIVPGDLSSPGVYPTAANCPHIMQGVPYDQTVQGLIDSVYDTTVTIVVSVQATFTIDSMQIDSIAGLPGGIGWQVNPAILLGGGHGCIEFSGTTDSAAGTYGLNAFGTVWTHAKATVPVLGTIDTPYTYKGELNSFSPFGGYYLVVNGQIALTTGFTQPTCNGESTGSAWVTAPGDSAYTYAWSTGATTDTINDVAAATYTVTVTLGSKNATASIDVTQPGLITANPSVTCSSTSSNNGAITLAPSGGTGPFTYSWSNDSTGASVSGLGAGTTLSVVITDVNACTGGDTITVSLCTGIANVEASQIDMHLYPNPASDVLRYSVSMNTNTEIDLSIKDLTGRTVYAAKKQVSGTLTDELNISNLASGTYFLEAIGNNESGRQPFIIQH